MVMVLMISRLRHVSAGIALLAGSALLTVACEKVPLLAPSGSTITLTALATALPSNGTTDIIAQVIEAGGSPPHSGTLITFTTNLGTVQPSSAETDLSGRVTVKYVAGSGSGTATIVAISGGVSASGTNAIKIAIGSSAVGGLTLSANPTSLSANGGTTTITANVNDGGGNTLPGVPVSFSTDNGALATSVVTSDANGRAQTTLTTSRTAKVTATAGVPTTSGTTTTPAATNTITITVNGAATVVFGAPTPSPAIAGQPVTMTLTITPSTTGAGIQNVVVNYGDGRTQTLGAISGATTLSHTYDSPGTYTVTATVTDTNGDQFPGLTTVSVNARPPANVLVTATPNNPQAGQQVAFTIATTFPTGNSGTVQSVSIDFGDGQSAQLGGQSTATAQHVYATAGAYTATAVVRDSNGGSSSGATQVIVSAKPQPAVALAATPNPSTLAQQPVSFTATVTQLPSGVTVDHYEWSFGDTTTRSTTSNTTNHSYVVGAYTASVTAVTSDGVRSTSSIEVRVTP